MIPRVHRPPVRSLPLSSSTLSPIVHDMPVPPSDSSFEDEFYECYVTTLPEKSAVKVEGRRELSRVDVFFRLMEWRREILGFEDEQMEVEEEVGALVPSGPRRKTIPGLRSEGSLIDLGATAPNESSIEDLHILPSIYNMQQFCVPPLVLQIHDLIGYRHLQPFQDGYFYYDTAIIRLALELRKRAIPYSRRLSMLQCPSVYQERAVRVYVQVPSTVKIGEMYEGHYRYIGECYLMVTHKFLSRRDWNALDENTRDFFITRHAQLLEDNHVPVEEEDLERLFDQGGVFPLIVLRQVLGHLVKPPSPTQPSFTRLAVGHEILTQPVDHHLMTIIPPAIPVPSLESHDEPCGLEEERGTIPPTPAPEYATEDDIGPPYQSELGSPPDTSALVTTKDPHGEMPIASFGNGVSNPQSWNIVPSPHSVTDDERGRSKDHDAESVVFGSARGPSEYELRDSGIDTDSDSSDCHVKGERALIAKDCRSPILRQTETPPPHGHASCGRSVHSITNSREDITNNGPSTQTIDKFDRRSLRARRVTDESVAWLATMFRNEQRKSITNNFVGFLESAYATRRRKKQTFVHIEGMLQTCYAQLRNDGLEPPGQWDEVFSSPTPPLPTDGTAYPNLIGKEIELGMEDLYEPIESFERFKTRYQPGASDTHTI